VINIPANAPHQFRNASTQPARLLCLCSPAGQEEFFIEVGVPVATRTTAPPKPDPIAQAALKAEKAEALASKYRTEFLKEANSQGRQPADAYAVRNASLNAPPW
jgi:hypothetical protein